MIEEKRKWLCLSESESIYFVLRLPPPRPIDMEIASSLGGLNGGGAGEIHATKIYGNYGNYNIYTEC